MDIIKNNFNSHSTRRESVDSGVGVSPPSTPLGSPPGNPDLPPIRRRNKKKKRLFSTLSASTFSDLYTLKNEFLGQGSCGRVETCVNTYTNLEYAVKIVNKDNWAFNRQKMLKEIELYYMCQGINESVIQLVDYFEDPESFFLIFEKAKGGHLLNQLNKKKRFSEKEGAAVMIKLASALNHLHNKGIAHRDLKPENILCMDEHEPADVRLCDFDLCSKVQPGITTPRLSSPVGSPEYLAPEVVEVFLNEDNILYDLLDEDDDLTYDKRCDLWSLGVICYTLLLGKLPFKGQCGYDCGWEDRNEECAQCQRDLYESIKRGQFDFPGDNSPYAISSSAKDLITKLLKINPDDRINASEILQHPWILKYTNDNSIEDLSEDLETDFIMTSPGSLRKAVSFCHSLSGDEKFNPGDKKINKKSAKFRRQSSIVVTSFCQQRREDLLCRCEL